MNTIPEDCPRCGSPLQDLLVMSDPEEETDLMCYLCGDCGYWLAGCQGISGLDAHWLIDSSNKHAFIVLGNPPKQENSDGCLGTTGIIG